MSPQEFFDKIMQQKTKANHLLEDPQGYNVKRGMAHSIAGFLEDLFAVYIATNLQRRDLLFLVDKVVSYRPTINAKAISFKPDLLILDKNFASHYYDLKTDIGFTRHLRSYLEKRNNFSLTLRDSDAWITVNKKIEHKISFSGDLKYSIVILIDWNVDKHELERNLEYAKNLEGIEIYVLINENKLLRTLSVDNNEFDRLMDACKRQFNRT